MDGITRMVITQKIQPERPVVMKRHESLVPLSRDHHGALILARMLQKGAPAYKGLPSDIQGKAAYASSFYVSDLVPHFAAEENSLLTHASGTDAEIDTLLNSMQEQHRQLKLLFEHIPLAEDLARHLDTLGYFLETHIRMEERQLFPMIQERCSAAVLDQISQSLTH